MTFEPVYTVIGCTVKDIVFSFTVDVKSNIGHLYIVYYSFTKLTKAD